ncbi:MAG: hypothetical protein IVW54_23475 [Candidatus Binataceae bacterium]|nr:hypothetical protein [Candidatus Binataceae bacterium]
MANSALAYQLGHGTLGVPLIIPTKGGARCGHYVQVRTSTGGTGFAFRRDPNVVCGLPVKSVSGASLQACVNNPQACSSATLPNGVRQVGTTPITGTTPNETMGNVAIR